MVTNANFLRLYYYKRYEGRIYIMKKIIKLLWASFFLGIIFVNSALGNVGNWEDSPGYHGLSILLDPNIQTSRDTINRYGRGEILSEGSVEIVNKKDGEIYVNVYTLAHKDVDRIRHVFYLDQWDESRQDWVQVDFMDFARTKEDEEDGTLSHFMTSITITGYPVNRYYRVRGMHLVELNGDIETCSTQTHGVYITKN